MPKASRIQLASGDLAPDVSLSVVLIRHANHERIVINWPARPTMASAAKYGDLIASVTRILGNGGIELARIQASNGRHTN